MQKLIYLLILSVFAISCGEETLTTNTQDKVITSAEIQSFEVSTCSQMHFEKPPVDILYVIDNSGSTLAGSFQAIKNEIRKTVATISNEFDYHIYFAPLNQSVGETITTYPLIVSDPSSLNGIANLNVVSIDTLNMFSQASGNNNEYGFQRVQNIINANRSNGIFRNNSNLIVVMISNGDDTQSYINIQGNRVFDPNIFTGIQNNFKNYLSPPMDAQSLRFVSLVANGACQTGWVDGFNYRKMSNDLYLYQSFIDNPVNRDSYDLCSGNYENIFNAVNNSIRQVIVGHKYDHWKISSANASNIQEDDITVTKILPSGAKVNIPRGPNDGFEYLGYLVNQNTRYEPDPGEPATGLMVKLNGSARVEYPECVIAKTRTPTEYFGYIALSDKPDLTTVEVTVAGQKYPQNNTNGWSYLGYRDTLNIKVPGPTNASVNPPLNKSGYFLQLHGNAIYTNGQTIKVFYKNAPK